MMTYNIAVHFSFLVIGFFGLLIINFVSATLVGRSKPFEYIFPTKEMMIAFEKRWPIPKYILLVWMSGFFIYPFLTDLADQIVVSRADIISLTLIISLAIGMMWFRQRT